MLPSSSIIVDLCLKERTSRSAIINHKSLCSMCWLGKMISKRNVGVALISVEGAVDAGEHFYRPFPKERELQPSSTNIKCERSSKSYMCMFSGRRFAIRLTLIPNAGQVRAGEERSVTELPELSPASVYQGHPDSSTDPSTLYYYIRPSSCL